MLLPAEFRIPKSHISVSTTHVGDVLHMGARRPSATFLRVSWCATVAVTATSRCCHVQNHQVRVARPMLLTRRNKMIGDSESRSKFAQHHALFAPRSAPISHWRSEIGRSIASRPKRHLSGEIARSNSEGEPERSPILSGIAAHSDPTLCRDWELNDVLRSVAGDAYVKSSRGIRIRHSYWRSCWCFRGRISDHHALWHGR